MNIVVLLLILILNSGCGQNTPERREYSEFNISPLMATDDFSKNHPFLQSAKPSGKNDMSVSSPEMADMLKASQADVKLSWKADKNWIEEPGNGMRVVTFKTQNDDPIECSIVSLAGVAGGIEANIVRWIGQININPLSAEELKSFIDTQEKVVNADGDLMPVLNFTLFQAQDPNDTPSMVASIIIKDDKTIFIKMTGSKTAVLSELNNFKILIKSLRGINEPSIKKN